MVIIVRAESAPLFRSQPGMECPAWNARHGMPRYGHDIVSHSLGSYRKACSLNDAGFFVLLVFITHQHGKRGVSFSTAYEYY